MKTVMILGIKNEKEIVTSREVSAIEDIGDALKVTYCDGTNYEFAKEDISAILIY